MSGQTGKLLGLKVRMVHTFAVAAVSILGTNCVAHAITWDLAGTGAWTTDANWNTGLLPTDADNVYINNAGTAQISSGDAAVARRFTLGNGSSDSGNIQLSGGTFTADGDHSYVGNSGTGTFTQTGGTFSIGTMALYLGMNESGNGTYTISGGSLTCQYIRVGQKGAGVFEHSGGIVTVNSQNLAVGRYNPSNGTYNLSGTGALSAPNEYIGCWGDGTGGTGTFNQTGGINTVAGNVYLGGSGGSVTGGTGTYTLSAGTLTVGGDIVDRGNTGGTSNFYIDGLEGAYTLTVKGGDVTVDNFAVGRSNGGSFTQKAGLTTTVNNNLSIGASGAASTIRVTGGTLSAGGSITGGSDSRLYIDAVESEYTLTVGGSSISVDRFTVGNSSTGEFTLPAGLTLTTDWQDIGNSGTGTLTQTGGTNAVTNGTGAIYLGHGSSGTGTYNMSGGSLVTNYLRVAENGTGTFNHSGGTVTINTGTSAYNLIVGRKTGSGGTYNLSGTGQVSARNVFIGGYEANDVATGHFNQTGGGVTTTENLRLGHAGGVGTYTISAGTLDVDGTLFVGSGGTGMFHIIGDQAGIEVDGYSQNADSTLKLTINGISPINVDGTISLAGLLDVEFTGVPSIDDVFPIFINDGDDLVSGIFTDMPEGYIFPLAGSYMDMVLTYQANLDGGPIGNDVALFAVPEPSAFILLSLGFIGIFAFARRRAWTHRVRN